MQARLHARPCNLWVMVTGSTSTCCTACTRYSIGITRNAMPPMHASRCNGSGCDYGNGLVSPTNPLTYDGRLLQSPLSPQNWNECGASHTGDAVSGPGAVSAGVETPAPASLATVRWPSSSSSSSSSTSMTSSIVITGTDNKDIRHATRRSQRLSSRKHQHKRAGASGPRPAY